VRTASIVCATCLPDPYAEVEREVKLESKKPQPVQLAGEVVGAQVRALAGHPG